MLGLVPKQKKYFISFADSRMAAATRRIAKQAAEMNFFDEILVYNESGLGLDFYRKWGHIAKDDVRGYGYWCWKPYIIKRALETLAEDDILLYCDAGCHLNRSGVKRLYSYVADVMRDSLGVKAAFSDFSYIDVKEKRWTKGAVFDYFGCRGMKDITDSNQIAATFILIRKCEASMQFVKNWNDIIENDISLIDDSPSRTPNLKGFLEHRHDQSVFSILFKLSGGKAWSAMEIEGGDEATRNQYPIWAIRDRGYKDTRFFSRVKRWLKAQKMMFKIRMEKLGNRLLDGK